MQVRKCSFTNCPQPNSQPCLQAGRCMLSYPLSLTSGRHVVAKTRMVNVIEAGSAISCICDLLRKSSCHLYGLGNGWREGLTRLKRKVEVVGSLANAREGVDGVLVLPGKVGTVARIAGRGSNLCVFFVRYYLISCHALPTLKFVHLL